MQKNSNGATGHLSTRNPTSCTPFALLQKNVKINLQINVCYACKLFLRIVFFNSSTSNCFSYSNDLELPHLPEMVFPRNVLTVIHPSGGKIEFNTLDALKKVCNGKPPIQVSYSEEWKGSRYVKYNLLIYFSLQCLAKRFFLQHFVSSYLIKQIYEKGFLVEISLDF